MSLKFKIHEQEYESEAIQIATACILQKVLSVQF